MKKANFLAALAATVVFAAVPAATQARGASVPPPDTPVLMVGDSMMRILGTAMEKRLKAVGVQPAVAFSSLGSGLCRPNVFDWNAKIEELSRQHAPKTVVVAIGANDRQALEGVDGGAIRYGTPEWEREYARRVGVFMDKLAAGGAKRVVWLLLPDMKDAAAQEHARLVNSIVAAQAAEGGRDAFVTLFDLAPVLTRRPGKFSQFMMSADGAAIAVRDADGVHLAPDGAKLCARAVVKAVWEK